MNTVLIIKNADFSENAISFENVYNIVKQTDIDVATPNYAIGNGKWYNNIPFSENATICAISFILSDKTPYNESNLIIGATDGESDLRHISLKSKDIVDTINKKGLTAGDRFDIIFDEPLTINGGEYIYIEGFTRCPVSYARTKSGNYGNMVYMIDPTADFSFANLAVTFYGIELD